MKIAMILCLIALAFNIQSSQAWWSVATSASQSESNSAPVDESHNEWLKKRFNEQHQALIPVVAVADMFFVCNQERKVDTSNYSISILVNKMDRNILAEKLSDCLGDDTMQSDAALNFGLLGCFHAQLAHLPEIDREQKMALVKQAISSLSHDERKKSFTQCVTEQSIHHLK